MLIKCCNPECQAPIDYRQGRLMRFTGTPSSGNDPKNRHRIQHYWLCGKCAELYVFDFESGTGVKLKPREQESSVENPSHFTNSA
jgi:hypothetical protein